MEELTIGAVAKRSGLAVSAIRYYEERGVITSERTVGDQRRFHRDVLRRLAFVQAGQRVGLSLEEIVTALETLPNDRAPTVKDWKKMSTAWRGALDDRIRILENLRDRVDSCIGCGCLSLQRCRLVNPDDREGQKGCGPRFLLPDRTQSGSDK